MIKIKPNPKTTPDAIAAAEKRMKFKFPKEYKAFLLECNGGSPEHNQLEIPDNLVSVRSFFGIGLEQSIDLVENWELEKHRLPRGKIGFADDGCGNDFRMNAKGAIFFHDHELPGAAAFVKVATSFSGFLAALVPFDASNLPEKIEGRIAWINPEFAAEMKRKGLMK